MSVANTYARALFEAASDAKTSKADLGQIELELSEFDKMIESSREVRIALYGPLITAKEKVTLVHALNAKAGFLPLVSSFLELLARKNRISSLPKIRDELRSVRLTSEGGLPGKLVSADAMSEADVADLSQAFTKKFGKRVAFQVETDPALLAGVKVTVNGVTYDGTLRSELQRLRDRVSRGAAVK
ncbi:MAG: ATP synthase F1 subunit delta [Bdellovibrionales bacterium GWB1_55_8]|nr:MAG: ATP synthase F1 subunit delta [Bdellovibrionales bacterium GWB1_55_8]